MHCACITHVNSAAYIITLGHGFHILSNIRLIRRIAYSIRIMLAHVRRCKRDQIRQPRDAATQEIASALHELLELLPHEPQADSQPSEGSQPSTQPSPFLSFQGDSDEESDMNEDDNVPLIMWKRLDHLESIIVGTMLYSNGKKAVANKYIKGTDGFIVCIWEDQDEQLSTTMPNDLLGEGGHFINRPGPPQVQPKKPPATPKAKQTKPKAKSEKKKKKIPTKPTAKSTVMKRPAKKDTSQDEEVAKLDDEEAAKVDDEEAAKVDDEDEHGSDKDISNEDVASEHGANDAEVYLLILKN